MATQNHFKISDFNITGEAIPEDVADKLLLYHLLPANEVRAELGIPMWPSMKSGYRPLWWERKQGRSGNSQHTFFGKGAVDWTCKDFFANKWEFLRALVNNTEYTRFAVYPNFIHCDYAIQDERWVFDENWVRQYEIKNE